jgi:hypothetical protein
VIAVVLRLSSSYASDNSYHICAEMVIYFSLKVLNFIVIYQIPIGFSYRMWLKHTTSEAIPDLSVHEGWREGRHHRY